MPAEQLQTPGLATFVIDTLLLVVANPTTPLTLPHVSERQAQGPGALPACSHMRRSDCPSRESLHLGHGRPSSMPFAIPSKQTPVQFSDIYLGFWSDS